ncbi:MAG: hydrogenase maturation protease [Bryobacteraceae bacterium]
MIARGKPPVLALGVGNVLLRDDGAGLRLLSRLRSDLSREGRSWDGEVEFMDGGTQGMALLDRIAGRRALLILDAVKLGAAPGAVHVLRGRRIGATRSSTAHESNVSELLAVSTLLGECPERLAIVGIEPGRIATGMELSEMVARAVPAAVEAARELLLEFVAAAAPQVEREPKPVDSIGQMVIPSFE